MYYHLIPTPTPSEIANNDIVFLGEETDPAKKKEAQKKRVQLAEFEENTKELSRELRSFLNSTEKKTKQNTTLFLKGGIVNDSDIFCLFSIDSMNSLVKKLSQASNKKTETTLVIHGDGSSKLIGLKDKHKAFDLTPLLLARKLQEALGPQLNTVTRLILLTCHSATTENNHNFAQKTSQALANLGCQNIEVIGFLGYVTSTSDGVFLVTSSKNLSAKRSTKDTTRPIEKAYASYENGKCIESVPPPWLVNKAEKNLNTQPASSSPFKNQMTGNNLNHQTTVEQISNES